MQRLTRGLWARHSQPLSAPQRAALLQLHAVAPANMLRVTGLSALELLGLPAGSAPPWIDVLLGDKTAPRGTEYQAASQLPHLSWEGARVRTVNPGMRITKSYGLPRYTGQWGCALADPLEALVIAAPFIPQWRLVACLDALISHQVMIEGYRPLDIFTPERLAGSVSLLPQSSAAVRPVARALRKAQGPTWSPAETLTRLIAVRHGCPRPSMNHAIRIEGRTYFLDLAWPEAKVAVEYNGGVHYENRFQYEDENYRLQRIRDHGWGIHVLVWKDLRDPQRRRMWLERLQDQLR